MTAPYKLETNLFLYPEMEYRYQQLDAMVFALREIPQKHRSIYQMTTDQKLSLESEHDLIVAWADFARSAFTKYHRESDLPCWEGHYEQFGVTMVNMIRLHEATDDPFIERLLPSESDIGHLYRVDRDSTDRVWCRSWFSLLGHPDFLRERIVGSEATVCNYTSLCLCASWHDFVNCVGRDRANEVLAA